MLTINTSTQKVRMSEANFNRMFVVTRSLWHINEGVCKEVGCGRLILNIGGRWEVDPTNGWDVGG